jgi:hypothetical protein
MIPFKNTSVKNALVSENVFRLRAPELDGSDCFHRYDPVSTGPNLIPSTGWEYFRNFGDMESLDQIFPVL